MAERGSRPNELPWTDRGGVPVLIGVQSKSGYARQTAVHDVRALDEGQILCGEFDETQLREALDRLVEERYGYQPDAESNGAGSNAASGTTAVAAGADYSVPAYVNSRRRFQLVDNWCKDLRNADVRARPFILKDGRCILERWTVIAKSGVDRGIRLAAQVAADELALRIRSFT